MPFELPDLDQKTYQQLVAELLRHIPRWTTQWTDYNDSDPGITLLQLLAWIDESLLYQANAIPIQTEQNYLRWVLGLAFSSNVTPYSMAALADNDFDFLALQQVLARLENGAAYSKEDLQQAVLAYVQKPYLALTLSNIETLAMQTNLVIPQQRPEPGDTAALLVRRAYARDADAASTAYILSDAKCQYHYPAYPNKLSSASTPMTLRKLLMLQIGAEAAAATTAAEAALCEQVRQYLTPRVIAGNQVRVRPAQLTDINLAMSIVCASGARPDVTLSLLIATLFRYFLPCEGGECGQGWAYGEAPAEEAVRHQVFGVAGIERIEQFDFNFIPTLELDVMATLDADAQLADLPPGTPAMTYRGLPRLRCLDISARSSPL